MEYTVEEVIEQAMHLDSNGRLRVAERLFASLEGTSHPWIAEAERRLDDYRNGRVESFSTEKVRKEIDQLLGR